MPHPKGNLKLSGDVHLPDAESDLDLEEGENDLAELGKDRRQPRGAAERVRAAGVLSSGDAQQQRPQAKAPARSEAPGSAASRAGARRTAPARPRSGDDPHGLAAAFREPVAHAARSAASTARRASPWAIWGLVALAAAALVRGIR